MPDPKPTDPDVIEAMDKLKEILKKMETEEGLKELEKGWHLRRHHARLLAPPRPTLRGRDHA